MFDFQEKRRFKEIVYSRPMLVCLFILLAFTVSGVLDVYGKARETAERRAERTADLASVKSRAAALEARVDRLSTERGVEEEIREKFDVARPGEQVMVLVDPTPAEVSASEEEQNGWWEKIKSWF